MRKAEKKEDKWGIGLIDQAWNENGQTFAFLSPAKSPFPISYPLFLLLSLVYQTE